MTFLDSDTIRRHHLAGQLAGAQAASQADDNRKAVDAAVAEGRIPESRRTFWMQHLAKAPGDAAILGQLAAPLHPPGTWPGL